MDIELKLTMIILAVIILFGGIAVILTHTAGPGQTQGIEDTEPVEDRITITDAVLDVGRYTGDWRLTVTATKPLPDMTILCCEVAGTTYAWGLMSEWTPLGDGKYTSLDTGMPTSYDDSVWNSVYFLPSQPQHFISWPPQPTVNLH